MSLPAHAPYIHRRAIYFSPPARQRPNCIVWRPGTVPPTVPHHRSWNPTQTGPDPTLFSVPHSAAPLVCTNDTPSRGRCLMLLGETPFFGPPAGATAYQASTA